MGEPRIGLVWNGKRLIHVTKIELESIREDAKPSGWNVIYDPRWFKPYPTVGTYNE